MDHKNIVIKHTGKRGRGIFAAGKIKKGEVVAEFDGPIYTVWYRKWNNDLYNHTIQIAPQKWRDSLGSARLLNHSCEPNCGIKNYTQVVAMRDIKAGEEITWDYEMTEDHPYWRMRCHCNTPSCRKVIGAYKNMPESTRKKYRGYISKWLLEKYPSK